MATVVRVSEIGCSMHGLPTPRSKSKAFEGTPSTCCPQSPVCEGGAHESKVAQLSLIHISEPTRLDVI
eukprot:10278860-Prorocentrum_lima.AAC.1